jgi:TolA-binding protein
VSLAAAMAVVGALFIGRHWLGLHRVGPLSYAVEGGRLEPGGAIEANGATEPTLRFSDGTEVMFLAGARGRVRSVDEYGARIALIGKARVDVVHWRGAHWLFDAGPFMITVKGTSFTAEWRDADERLEIVLKTGSVAVSGPLSDEAITLRAGQRLTISAREKEVVIRDIDAAAETNAVAVAPRPSGDDTNNAPPSTPEAPPSEKGARRPAPSLPAPSSPASWNWPAELAAGHFAIILQQAEQRGLETALAEVSSDDLAALADAARYSRREDVARRALSAQMRRYPQSARANDAAFLLGRLEETARHPELALAWYERCLTESPRGTYTSEALGRKMTVVQRLYGAARARPIAEEYLRRFDGGTYAAAARALTRMP